MSNDNSNYTVDLHSEVLTFMTMTIQVMYIYLRIYINNVPVHDLHNEVCGSKVWWWGDNAKLRSSPPPQSGAGRLERRCLSGNQSCREQERRCGPEWGWDGKP